MEYIEAIKKVGIVPVIRLTDADKAVPLAQALAEGGLCAAEVTFRSDAAQESIRRIAKECPRVFVCAGTVLDVPTAQRAAEAGAKAIISPGINPAVIDFCQKAGIPVIPGCATPTEVEFCMRAGLSFVKLFPAEVVGGVPMLKALSGPYASVRFMPTGGINTKNVREYLKLQNVVACGGSWIAPEPLIDAGDFKAITRLAAEAALLAAEAAG